MNSQPKPKHCHKFFHQTDMKSIPILILIKVQTFSQKTITKKNRYVDALSQLTPFAAQIQKLSIPSDSMNNT